MSIRTYFGTGKDIIFYDARDRKNMVELHRIKDNCSNADISSIIEVLSEQKRIPESKIMWLWEGEL